MVAIPYTEILKENAFWLINICFCVRKCFRITIPNREEWNNNPVKSRHKRGTQIAQKWKDVQLIQQVALKALANTK